MNESQTNNEIAQVDAESINEDEYKTFDQLEGSAVEEDETESQTNKSQNDSTEITPRKKILEEKRNSRHIQDRLVATVDDTCKTRTYHIVETNSGFTVVPHHRKEDEEWGKRWKVNKSFECNCSQSEHVAECTHVEAVKAAIENDYDASHRCIAIAEGRFGGCEDIEWYELLDEEAEDGLQPDRVLVAINQIGDTIKMYDSIEDQVGVTYGHGNGGYGAPLMNWDTDTDGLTAFTDSHYHRKQVLEHIREVAVSRFQKQGESSN